MLREKGTEDKHEHHGDEQEKESPYLNIGKWDTDISKHSTFLSVSITNQAIAIIFGLLRGALSALPGTAAHPSLYAPAFPL